MKLHTKYYMRFLWLCRVTGLTASQLRMFIASLLPGEQKRVGDYLFRLLSVRHAGKDIIYSVEVYFIDSDDDYNNVKNHYNNNGKKSKTRLVLKSPLLIDAPRRNNRRRIAA